jgi:hypothetical protein
METELDSLYDYHDSVITDITSELLISAFSYFLSFASYLLTFPVLMTNCLIWVSACN